MGKIDHYTHSKSVHIHLLTTEVYSSILSVRINDYCDLLDIMVDEQNGFRRGRSCIDHIFSITSIVKNSILMKQSVFCAFIDFQKAFDCINRNLLFIKRVSNNLDRKIYRGIKSLHKYTKA